MRSSRRMRLFWRNRNSSFFTIKSIDKNLPQRLELWAFSLNFTAIHNVERSKVDALQRAHDVIRGSKWLRVLLSTILAFGNHMNGGSRKGVRLQAVVSGSAHSIAVDG